MMKKLLKNKNKDFPNMIPRSAKDAEQMELSYVAGGSAKW